MKYVVTLETENIAIGPFKSLQEAQAYRDTDLERDKMKVLEIVDPLPNWKKTALTNWPNGVDRTNNADNKQPTR
jgi:hypothetical protein